MEERKEAFSVVFQGSLNPPLVELGLISLKSDVQLSFLEIKHLGQKYSARAGSPERGAGLPG